MMVKTNEKDDYMTIQFNASPGSEICKLLKENNYFYYPQLKIWSVKKTDKAQRVFDFFKNLNINKDYGLKLKIKDLVSANSFGDVIFKFWVEYLSTYMERIMSEDNKFHQGNSVSQSQKDAWLDCFKFIAENLKGLDAFQQEFELVFEYSLPGTVHNRPDVFLLTDEQVISLEFKRKIAPQVDDHKDDVAQAIGYKEQLINHHECSKKRNLKVYTYLVCTNVYAKTGNLRGVDILTRDNFCKEISRQLENEKKCSFTDEWLSSIKTEMPDMIKAIERMYQENKIPYLSDVNNNSLKMVKILIERTKNCHKKLLILIDGVPGAGKTAIGQSIVFEENKNGKAKAVYLSGNGPLIEVLQYQINQIQGSKHMAENVIQGMKEFKTSYFVNNNGKLPKIPEQAILVFDEAQRAWDANQMKRCGLSEPEGLFEVGNRIYDKYGYCVIVGLYGNGQSIHRGEEVGIPLWEQALKRNEDWYLVASEEFVNRINISKKQKRKNDLMHLSASLRADFIDCSKWVEQAIGRNDTSLIKAKEELSKLQRTSMKIYITRDISRVESKMKEIDQDHPNWNYGYFHSNLANKNVMNVAFENRKIGSIFPKNIVQNGEYGPWYSGECKNLNKTCSVFGNQGLELDIPIVLFGGDYKRKNGQWIIANDYSLYRYNDVKTIVENNYRVLLTRARKKMIIVVPNTKELDETYKYFIDMGVDVL